MIGTEENSDEKMIGKNEWRTFNCMWRHMMRKVDGSSWESGTQDFFKQKTNGTHTSEHPKVEDMDVSENSGTPQSSILIGFSIKNHPFWGTTIFGNTQLFMWYQEKAPLGRTVSHTLVGRSVGSRFQDCKLSKTGTSQLRKIGTFCNHCNSQA